MDGEWIAPGYRHIRTLGEGASGRVVHAEHQKTGTPVAIKYLSPRLSRDAEFLNRFREEARLLADLQDPNLVRFHEYVESTRGAAIVMELVNGVSLAALLQSEGPTGPEAALVVLKGSLAGLAAAHAVGVVHRDYKPGNVLIGADGSSKLADFGIAVPAGTDAPTAGTPAYMAPEQWSGAPATPATDVYAATAVFYECLTGEHPYSATTIPQLALAHQSADIPAERVPEPLRDLVAHGLAKDPSERPPSAHAFLDELETAATGAYGAEWEQRGRDRLKERAALLALLFPLGRPGNTAATTVALTELGGDAGRASRRVRAGRGARVATAAVIAGLALIGGGTAAVVAGNSGADTPVAQSTDGPGGPGEPGTGPGAGPGEGPSVGPSPTPTGTASPGASPTPTGAPSGTPGTGPGAPGGTGIGDGGGTAGTGTGGTGTPPEPPTETAPPPPQPFEVTAVNVAVSRAIGSRSGSFTVSLSTKGQPARRVPVAIRLGPGLQLNSPSSITLSPPSYSATYSLVSGCGEPDTPWSWTVTAVAAGKSATGSTSGPYYPQDKFCG